MNQRTDDVLTDLLTELGGRADGPAAMPSELGTRIARRRRRHSVVGAAGAVVALAAVGTLTATVGFGTGSNGDGHRTVVMPGASVGGSTVEESPTPTPTPTPPPTPAVIGGDHAADCPAGALPLADSDARMMMFAKVVLNDLPRLYGSANDTAGATVTKAEPATNDSDGYGGIAIQACGADVAARTLVVTLDFPAMGSSASLSSGVVFVSRTDAGWTPWRVVR